MSAYILDANVFIDSHQRQYGMDFCPAFWDWLAARNTAGRVFSIDRICDELEKFDDVLCGWAKARGDQFFLPSAAEAAKTLPLVTRWVEGKQNPAFKPAAKARFFASADLFLIAYAMATGGHVVTQEVSAPHSSSTVKIPDVCVGLGVPCISLWQLLRAEGARFVAAL